LSPKAGEKLLKRIMAVIPSDGRLSDAEKKLAAERHRLLEALCRGNADCDFAQVALLLIESCVMKEG